VACVPRALGRTLRFDAHVQKDATMVIRFTSTLTEEDESCIAPALLKAVANLLAPFPISYSLRIETTAGDVVEDGRSAARSNPWPEVGSRGRRESHDRGGSFDPPR
jgi:hypothetical protein